LPAEGENSKLLSSLVDLFEELSGAVEKISGDYHNDYVFKRYLQDKWNEVVESAKAEDRDAATV
jgi:hypothetical protein